MTIQQTFEIQRSTRHLTVDLPQDIPAGTVEMVIFFPTPTENPGKVPNAPSFSPLKEILPALGPEEALREATRRATDPSCKRLSRHRGTIKDAFGGDGLAYQQEIRAEW
jgi:hypothetical protein